MTDRRLEDLAELYWITGLPGSGKGRFGSFLRKEYGLNEAFGKLSVAKSKPSFVIDRGEEGFLERLDASEETFCRVLCVVDARSAPPEANSWAAERLNSLLPFSDAMVLAFADEVSLLEQNRWTNRVMDQYPGLKLFRWGRHTLDFPQFSSSPQTLQSKKCFWNSVQIQTFRFDLGKVVLDHLMMVLDNARRSLGMQILRAKGVFDTLEYDNLVAVEAGVERIDIYAAESQDFNQPALGMLCLQGVDFDPAWLESMLHACRTG
ncbi:GTP-binding protein [Thiomicrorhabdus sp.]|uniref:GTP-binding protein n=1 Tax=Thiomicrorhabdus sp. TaxID=2039724 RepID=UPI0029C84CEE|nr:GTP-binding protein [Thiomicrorhabdus sp.]